MSSAANNSLSDCESRSTQIERRMRYLWVPGARKRFVNESYAIGYASKQQGAFTLAEANFRRAARMMEGRRPRKTKNSLATFSVVAACHNHLGLLYLDSQRVTDASASFDEAIRLRTELRDLFPDDRENEVYLGSALCNRGHSGASADANRAAEYYQKCLSLIRQPTQDCECSYWDEVRQSWWCEQLEALGDALKLEWVAQAPLLIDDAMQGLRSLYDARKTGEVDDEDSHD